MARISFYFFLAFFIGANLAHAKTVHYEIVATKSEVNLSGKKKVDFALMLNGQIPAPTLEFTEGDVAEIVVKNKIPHEELSIHWHGILLPPMMDGVPYVTTPPIRSGEEYTFRFKIRQHGTFWYHSHTDVQEQKGVFGAFIIHPKKETIKYDKDLVVVLNDWSDENATRILNNLRKSGDYYLFKKDTVRSWLGAIEAKSLGNYLKNEWNRLGGMDYSDIGYDAFLINGKRDSQLIMPNPGEKIRIRIINASASTYFYVALGKSPMKIISADGTDIEQVFANEILMGMAETYDVLFTVPEHKNYELKITSQDGTGTASGWIGMGEKVTAPVKPFPDSYMSMGPGAMPGMKMGPSSNDKELEKKMDMPMPGKNVQSKQTATNLSQMKAMPLKKTISKRNGSDGDSEEQNENEMEMDMDMPMPVKIVKSKQMVKNLGQTKPMPENPADVVASLSVDDIKALKKSEYPKAAKVYELKLVLGGDMRRYIWFINGKAFFEDPTFKINEGDIVRITFVNETMMPHPMHLHGHFFRVLNKFGSFSPIKHTVDVPPLGTRTIEFLADEPGEWMLHCHNLFHLEAGMSRVVKYSSFTPSNEIARFQEHNPLLHDNWYHYGLGEVSTNHAQGYYRLSQTWNQLEARIETRNTAMASFSYDKPWELEGDLFYRRWFGRYLNLVLGGSYFDQRTSAVTGFGYTLPFLVETNFLVDHRGKLRLDVDKRFQWTKSILSDVNFTWRPDQGKNLGNDVEYEISLMYAPTWAWSGGLMFTNDNIGAGLQLQF